MGRNLFFCLLLVLLSCGIVQAQVPQTMSYQGVLADASGAAVPDGSYNVFFRIYDDVTTGNLLWTEGLSVEVHKGVFSVVLGTINPLSIPFDREYWLGVAVDLGDELSPRTRITASPYCLNSRSVADGAITSASIAGGQVVKSINTLRDDVTLAAGSNVTITPSGNTLTIAATGGGNGDITAVVAGTGLSGGGASGDVTLAVAVPLSLTGSSAAYSGIGIIGGINSGLGPGVRGDNVAGHYGELGHSNYGVFGKDATGDFWGYIGNFKHGVYGQGSGGDWGALGGGDYGVAAYSDDGNGVSGHCGLTGHGVEGEHIWSGNYGYLGTSSYGVYGESIDQYGVRGVSTSSYGIYATSASSTAVRGIRTGGGDWAGRFAGNVEVTGTLSKGGGSFKIDHPIDPENKYLYHSFVESPDMMNIYNGNAALDGSGEAWVELPEWFEALNGDFRYQLTPIGAPGPNLHVAERVANNRFKIAGGTEGMEVSWQVTGIRRDPFANAHRIAVEVDKPAQDRGKYLYAREYGVSETRAVDYDEIRKAEEEMTAMRDRQRLERERYKAENEKLRQRGGEPR